MQVLVTVVITAILLYTTFQGKCILTKSGSVLLTSRIWKLQSVLFIIRNHLDCLRSFNKMFYNSYIRELMDEDYVDVWFDKDVGMLAMVDIYFHFTFFIITFFYHVITVYFHFFSSLYIICLPCTFYLPSKTLENDIQHKQQFEMSVHVLCSPVELKRKVIPALCVWFVCNK